MTRFGTQNEHRRIEWLKAVLRRIPAGSRILDAGAGEQRFRGLCSHLEYVSQDFARYDGKGDGRGLQTGFWEQADLDIVSDIVSIPVASGSFDAIMCIEVFEHLPEPVLAIKEFSRLLKDGGHLVVTAPFCSLTHFAPYHYATGFNAYFYQKHFADAGFRIVEIVPNGNFFEYLGQEIHRVPEIANRYCHFKLNFFQGIALRLMLRVLEHCSHTDRGSSEMLCFGYHVHAVKIRQ
ncbi:class I SAM-dependent methyltransferase [Trichlorobacter ammonificans]|uniref:Ubiquinone/menaquinone biosynthesis protein n=1 Tax=Trichlorobacter ammonificans TaxID=2916410 RepID=A0ABM9D770_9BACT|nr:class I SAM-dependent methyltransferase [Trichlorobacter ammonificans]CAH2031078.1 Ubiquinone/menaquinone biosynthesis protein [Trichlorobacter ammonificans]